MEGFLSCFISPCLCLCFNNVSIMYVLFMNINYSNGSQTVGERKVSMGKKRGRQRELTPAFNLLQTYSAVSILGSASAECVELQEICFKMATFSLHPITKCIELWEISFNPTKFHAHCLCP